MIERAPMPFMEWQIIQRVQMLLRQAKTSHLACRRHLRNDQTKIGLQLSSPPLDSNFYNQTITTKTALSGAARRRWIFLLSRSGSPETHGSTWLSSRSFKRARFP